MKKVFFCLLALLPFITNAEQLDPNDFYAQQPSAQNYQKPTASEQPEDADNSGDQTAAIVLNLESYKPLGSFVVPQGVERPFIGLINSKIFILSEQPDKRLAGLWIGRSPDGREALCGYLNNSMQVRKCYYILYRE